MRFEQPEFLHGLWLAALAGLFLFWALKRKQKILQRFAQPHLAEHLAASWDLAQETRKILLLCGALALGVIAAARPQWGFELQEVKRQGIDILLAIDVSKSMLTEDVKPNRLERTKLAVKDLIKKLKGDRIGLIGFAGDAFLFCPLTVDYGGFLLSLEDLDVTSVPRGGTNLSQAMSEALKEYENVPAKYKAVVIVTDGENLEGDPLAMARRAKEKGIKVYCVGIGTKEGDLVRVQDMVGGHEFLKDENGNFVKSRLNEDLLQKVALATGGMYVRASGAQFGLDMIYDRELAKMERRDLETRVEKKYFDRFQVPLALALVLLVWETCLVPRKAKFI